MAATGSAALVLALLAEATQGRLMGRVTGMPDLGVAAAAELGVDLDRLALIPDPGAELVAVLSALIDGFDLVVLGPVAPHGVQPQLARRLAGWVRNRGNQAAAALRAGAIVVSDARYVDAGRVTLAVAPLDGPVDHTVTAPAFALPHHPHAPVAMLTATTATALGLGTVPFTVAASTSRMPTADEQDRLQARLGQKFEVRVDRGIQQDGRPLTILAIVAGVVTLATALATGLAAADGRADLAALAALGTPPRMRRALSLSQAGVIAGLGSIIGTLAGLGTAIAVLITLNQATADAWPVQQPLPIIVPWLNIGTALVVVPLIAMLGAGLLTRSRLPIER
jgi:putative ABC transport system permease protein